MNYIILALLSAVSWGLSPFIDKLILRHLTFYTAYILKSLVIFLTSMIMIFFFRHKLDVYSKLRFIQHNKLNLIPFLIIATGIFGSLGTFFYFFSMKNSKNSYLVLSITFAVPIIIFTCLVWIFLKEKLTLRSLFGILLVCFGLILIK